MMSRFISSDVTAFTPGSSSAAAVRRGGLLIVEQDDDGAGAVPVPANACARVKGMKTELSS